MHLSLFSFFFFKKIKGGVKMKNEEVKKILEKLSEIPTERLLTLLGTLAKKGNIERPIRTKQES